MYCVIKMNMSLMLFDLVQDMVSKWTSYIDGSKQLRTVIDAADVTCQTDVTQLTAVPLQTLEHILADKTVCR